MTRTLTEPTSRAGVIGLGMIGGAVATRLAGPAVCSVVPESLPDNAYEGDITMMEKVMGDRIGGLIRQAPRLPVLASTIEQLFAANWSRISLTVRDRRLLAVGATVMLGRTDLLTNDLTGALRPGNSPPISCASSVCSCTTKPAGATAPRWTPSWRN
jgi:alkylhydroperoxidase/carboxymuconolactone decarboxylase family protein YurZ